MQHTIYNGHSFKENYKTARSFYTGDLPSVKKNYTEGGKSRQEVTNFRGAQKVVHSNITSTGRITKIK